MARAQSVAVLIRSGDVIYTADGHRHVVTGTVSQAAALGGITLRIRCADGITLNVSAGALLDIERT